ncbi:MAG: ABC transporter permease [Pyrinomonadaceae bacterium]|nr:ABC transporter permease [Pyrinomonadaceae bacterium]
MPYEIFLAWRYVRGRGRGGPATARVTTLVAVVGIACGVGALIVALALANGFRDELRDKILRGTAHVTAARADGRAITNWPPVVARLRGVAGVTDAAPTSYAGALLAGPDGGAAYAVVRGVAAMPSGREAAEIRRTLVAGAAESLFQAEPAPAPSSGAAQASREGAAATEADVDQLPPADAVLGVGLAARTGLTRVGDVGWLVTGEPLQLPSVFSGLSLPAFVPRSRRVRVAGLFRTGLHDYDESWIYASLETAAGIVNLPAGSAPVVSIQTGDIYETPEVAARVREALGAEFTVVDWQEANRPLFAALALERRTVAFIIALIMIVAALNITTSLVLVVVERRAEIAILGAMGARPASVMLIFMLEGALIGALGALAGVTLGLLACYVGDHYALVRLPAEVYSLDSIPLHPRAGETLLAALAAFLICLVATLYPARAAARTRPAEALRYE